MSAASEVNHWQRENFLTFKLSITFVSFFRIFLSRAETHFLRSDPHHSSSLKLHPNTLSYAESVVFAPTGKRCLIAIVPKDAVTHEHIQRTSSEVMIMCIRDHCSRSLLCHTGLAKMVKTRRNQIQEYVLPSTKVVKTPNSMHTEATLNLEVKAP